MKQTPYKSNTTKDLTRATKLFSQTSIFFLVLFVTTNLLAQTNFEVTLKSVSITDAAGTNSPPIAYFTYSKTGDVVTLDASGSHDAGAIIEYRWDFGDGTKATGVTTNHQFTTENINVTLSVVDDIGGITLVQKNISFAPPISVAVNFQPINSAVPEGFIVDSGASFNASAGYGWTLQPPASSASRDRNSSLSPDQSYDTLIHVTPTAIWEYQVPNGSYHVTVTVGDPSYPDKIQGVQVEGISLINAASLSTSMRWIKKDVTVEVADGKLTLSFLTSTTGKPCWVKIESL